MVEWFLIPGKVKGNMIQGIHAQAAKNQNDDDLTKQLWLVEDLIREQVSSALPEKPHKSWHELELSLWHFLVS